MLVAVGVALLTAALIFFVLRPVAVAAAEESSELKAA
ncbi:MAG: hypothetical protein QOG65_3112 [Actinomycetota bacterium]|jgi:hypothetical protein|nr:hypothetical protein [Actinomycetota bacterium]MDQ1385733.1 hypothetical protein [Actinomycetota bacterium]